MSLALSPTPEEDYSRLHEALRQAIFAEPLGFDYLCQMNWGGIAHDRVMASMQRFGEQIMPTFRP
jgi:hypothetical protein